MAANPSFQSGEAANTAPPATQELYFMTRYLLLAAFCGSILAGCGYRGDLYLPKKNDNNQFGTVQTGLTIEPIQPQHIPDHE